jgi:hypothetical protein
LRVPRFCLSIARLTFFDADGELRRAMLHILYQFAGTGNVTCSC